jgi:hypothetical protein
MADTNKGQSKNPDQHCYTDNNNVEQDPGAVFRSFVRDPRTVFTPAPQMPDPVRGLSDNLDQLCYPSQAPMSIQAFFDEEPDLQLPTFGFTGPLNDLCKFIPELCDKLPKTIAIDFNATTPCLVVDGNPCKDPTEGDFTPKQCVQDAINCIFKPYADGYGGWSPSPTDGDTFFPPGFNRNKDDKTCIINCVPDRLPVYEWRYAGSDATDYYYTVNDDNAPSGYVRLSPSGSGGAVKRVSISKAQSNGVYGQGDWKLMVRDKSFVNEAGAQWWPSEPKKRYSRDFPLGNKGCVLDMVIAAKPDGGDYDTRYVLKEIDNGGNGYTVGETFPLNSPTTGVTLGYVRVEEITNTAPAFWILKNATKDSVPLYHYYSSSRKDSFLTTDPSAETNRLTNGSYISKGILGYVLTNNENMQGYLCDGEISWPLHRYYQSSAAGGGQTHVDHRYSIVPLIPNEVFKPEKNKLHYRLPLKVLAPMVIRYKAQRGTAGKKSSWGYYFADASGVPQKGFVIRKNATDFNGSGEITVSPTDLETYAGATLGFFLIPGGNGASNISDGTQLTFQKVTLGSGRVGYQAYAGGSLVYARAGTSGNSGGGDNYVFFSNRQLNPQNQQWTSWSGKFQGWEDWEGGDKDFDDVIISYNLKWKGATNYKAEGVQCYVFKDDKLPPIYMSTKVRSGCETDRLFKVGFKDPIIQRLGCGSEIDGTNKGGTCTGSYVVQYETDQTITIRMDGDMTLYSWGCDIISGDADETVWKMKITKNGSDVLLDDEFSTLTYPKKGRVLHPTFDVKEGDTLRLQITDILSGAPSGTIWPKISFYDELNEIHESISTITIRTGSIDEQSYSSVGTSANSGISQIVIENIDGTSSTTGWSGGATASSLIVEDGDYIWRKVNKSDREKVLYQRQTIPFTKNGNPSAGLSAIMQVRFEPVPGVASRYDTKVTIEQLVFTGSGYSVGDQVTVDFPISMYYGTTRIPNNKKVKVKFKVTGVG